MKKGYLFIVGLCSAGSRGPTGTEATYLWERQASTPMTVTSVHLTQGGGTITAEGDMGEYGRAYLTYTLTADANGMGGTVVGEGRGAMQGGAFASGSWHRRLLPGRHHFHHARDLQDQ